VIGKQPYQKHWYGTDARVYFKLDSDSSLAFNSEKFYLTHEIGWSTEVSYRYFSEYYPSEGTSYAALIRLPGSRSLFIISCDPVTGLKKTTRENIVKGGE
jgi:hypothetical protein